ncbi:class I SAM-dependent methyltransferase [Natronosalvus rutilus]|uniref:Class I SAM-dependent methyltransferase n=1 Tax=Natronosalvus rutilus TaxID=2953753 RepID=A0A9E7SUY3_9EURY|nr:class I SAM-dependent methyltransferase [Natronosalvus rutilus]UTF53950.1 class I SAM-dependent methyltransferase [Natronosalvus rutilus]
MSEETQDTGSGTERREHGGRSDRDDDEDDRTRAQDLSSLDPERYYDEYGHEEWNRLEATLGGHLEFEGTTTYLERYLPNSGHVLDAGGGAGRYAVWLAERGYSVTLADQSRRQCEIARAKVREHGVADRVTVERADLRALPFAGDRFDAVCCTGGPLSHLTDESSREQALAELRRVARSESPVFVSVMGRLALLQNLVRSVEYAPGILAMVESGTYDADFAREHLTHLEEPGFTACHFFRAAELEAVLESAGFEIEALVGLEGIAANVGERQDLEDLEPDVVEAVTEAVRGLRTDPAVVDWSNHILVVARA